MIRELKIEDIKDIQALLTQLGYPQEMESLCPKLERLISNENEGMLVYEDAGRVLGLISYHYIVQLGFDGEFCEISYFVVDENCRGQRVGAKLEEALTEKAKDRKCHLMSVFSMAHRKDAHRFYERQGYKVMEKYFEKEL